MSVRIWICKKLRMHLHMDVKNVHKQDGPSFESSSLQK